MDREIERCCHEIAAIEAEVLAGNPDVEGLVLALSDWSAELRILEEEQRRRVSSCSAKLESYEQVRLDKTGGETGAI